MSTVVAGSQKGLSWQHSERGEYFHLNPQARVGDFIFNTNPQWPGEITGDCVTLTTKFDATYVLSLLLLHLFLAVTVSRSTKVHVKRRVLSLKYRLLANLVDQHLCPVAVVNRRDVD